MESKDDNRTRSVARLHRARRHASMHDTRIVREADEPGGGTPCKRVMQVRPVHAVTQDIPCLNRVAYLMKMKLANSN
jgi:hypothetical protein